MAMDPFSAASKPLPPASLLYTKQPLQFAATFREGPLLPPLEPSPVIADFASAAEVGGKGKGKDETYGQKDLGFSSPSEINGPRYHHGYKPSIGLDGLGSLSLDGERRTFRTENGPLGDTGIDVESDEWMESFIGRAVDKAILNIDLSNLGLTRLSDRISSLSNLTILPSRSSPAQPPYIDSPAHPATPRSPNNPTSPFLPQGSGNSRLSPGLLGSGTSAGGRTFQRYSSAPPASSSSMQSRMRESSSPSAATGPGLSTSPIQHVNIASGLPSTSTLNTRPFQRVPSKGFAPPGSAVPPDDDEEDKIVGQGEAEEVLIPSPKIEVGFSSRMLRPSPAGSNLGPPIASAGLGTGMRSSSSKQVSFGRKVSFQDPSLNPSSAASPPTSPSRPTNDKTKRSPSSPSATTNRRLKASASAPPTSSPTSATGPLGDSTSKTRAFMRTASGTMSPRVKAWRGEGNGDVMLSLANNSLTCLPSALFQISTLVVLSLRQNRLTALPAAIGELKKLKELNIGNNKIETFPPTLLDLKLDKFFFPMNPLKTSASYQPLEPVPSGRKLGPLQTNPDFKLSLRNTCISVLLSPRHPDDIPPLLSEIDWEPEVGSKGAHGLQDAVALKESQNYLTMDECDNITKALRSAHRVSAAASRKLKHSIPDPAFSPSSRPRRNKENKPEDASANPYFSPCPNPSHTAIGDIGHLEDGQITRRIYIHMPAEERIEWVKVSGADEEVPILWKGCSPGCLRFLEEADEDEDEAEDTEVDEEDGFGADVLSGDGDWA